MGNKEDLSKNVFKKLIADLEKAKKEEPDFLEVWEKTAGKKANAHTKLAFLKGKRLVVNVSDSSWLYKLTLEKEKLIKKFNDNLKGKKRITQLQFRIGDTTK